MRQFVPGLRENGQWAVAISHLAAAVAIVVVIGLLAIAVVTSNGVASSDGTESSSNQPMAQALAGFGLIGLWLISGAVLAARARPGRKLTFGQPNRQPTPDREDADDDLDTGGSSGVTDPAS